MVPYKFANTAREVKPDNDDVRLLEKADTYEDLTRKEKDRIVEILYSNFGSRSSVYKVAGWAWDMKEARQMRRILVRFIDDPHYFEIFWAPDKKSLWNVLPITILEMVYA